MGIQDKKETDGWSLDSQHVGHSDAWGLHLCERKDMVGCDLGEAGAVAV